LPLIIWVNLVGMVFIWFTMYGQVRSQS
jgi:hypothetical protein